MATSIMKYYGIYQFGKCPSCDSDEIEGGPLDAHGDLEQATQKCRCLVCDFKWYDVYRIMGFEPVEDPSDRLERRMQDPGYIGDLTHEQGPDGLTI